MKKHLLTAIILFLSITIYAQRIPSRLNIEPMNLRVPANHSSVSRSASVSDTDNVYLLRATGATIYTVQTGGYLFGTSYYYDTASAAYYFVTDESGIEFDSIGNAQVTDVIAWFGRKQIVGTPDNIEGKIYSVDTVPNDSMPLNELASGVISTDNIDTSNSLVFTDIPITSGNPNITTKFFVSISYAGIDDTIGIVSSKIGDGMNEKRVRQLEDANFGGLWVRMGELYNFIDVDIFVMPIVTLSSGVGINNHFDLKDATLDPVYPTPANDNIHLGYTLKNSADVSYKLFDLKGTTYLESKAERQGAGTYSKTLDISQCAVGKYFLTVNINGNPVTQKVMVVK